MPGNDIRLYPRERKWQIVAENRENKILKANGQTFVVNIKCRQNHTWQGTVNWVEQKKALPFRSALELIKLMDSAMESTEEEENTTEW